MKCVFVNGLVQLLVSKPLPLFLHSDGSVIVSFVVYFKTPVSANEGLSKQRGAVENNRKLGNFTVGGLKIIQPVNPTTAALTEESTRCVVRISTQKGDLTVKKDILGSFCNHDADGNKNANNHFMDYLKTQRKFPCLILHFDLEF